MGTNLLSRAWPEQGRQSRPTDSVTALKDEIKSGREDYLLRRSYCRNAGFDLGVSEGAKCYHFCSFRLSEALPGPSESRQNGYEAKDAELDSACREFSGGFTPPGSSNGYFFFIHGSFARREMNSRRIRC